MARKKSDNIKITWFDHIFGGVVIFFVLVLTAVFIFPLLNVLASSLSAPGALMGGKVWVWPVNITFEAYGMMLSLRQLWSGYANSIFYAAAGTCINLLFTIAAAYPLSKRDLMGKPIFMAIFLFTMFFSGGLVPGYMLVNSLGLVNTRWALLIPGALNVSYMIIARTFFSSTIPQELYDAAEIDGAGDFTTLVRIVLPLSGAVLAVLGLYYAVIHWNGYFDALIFLTDYNKYPLQLIIRDYLMNSKMLEEVMTGGGSAASSAVAETMAKREVLKYAIIVVAALPMILIYPFVQRYFVQGVMIGSIKG